MGARDEGLLPADRYRIAGASEPRSYVIPWNLTLAEKLEDAIDDAVRKRSTFLLKKPFYRRRLEEWGDLNVEINPRGENI